jgi:alkanesulfonate monooxygenase SsuD/methylene tetrahydromethanopterin reductase-like flavin-dependent oxidoreductase (luciferase family)
VITRLWKSAAVDFEGKHFSLKGATISPRPKQQPLPLWLGGSSQAAIRRTARFGHGWLAPLQSPAEAAISVQAIREESRRIGRPIPDDHYGATILFRIGRVTKSEQAPSARPEYQAMIEKVQAIGEPDVVLDRLREFRNGGITKFIAIPLARSSKEMMEQSRLLDQEVLPHANDQEPHPGPS